MKRVLSIFLAVLMLLSAAPLSGFIGLELPKLSASAYTTGTYENLTYNEYDTYIEITKGDEAATTVVIPSKINNKPVTHISETAFYDFNKLESVTIGDSVSSISANNFSHCTKLQKIEVSPNNLNFCSVDGVLFSKDKTELLDYPGGREGVYNIPNTVVNITAQAFRGASITGVNFPDSVKSIGNSAFSSCYKLSSVALPESLTLLDEYAFYSCQSIESVTIGNNLEVISSDAFNGCLKLSSITIPDSVKLIGHEAFNDTVYYNNKDNWKNGVLYIGKNLIEADYEITGEYTIKSGTKSISDFAFSGCQIQGIVIPDSVETIGENAFNGCSALNSIIIPSSVTSIGEEAFDDCSAITAFNVSEKNTQYCSEDGVLFNKDKTVLICYPIGSAAERYIIPSTVLTIEKRAFYGCEALKSVCIGDSVTNISNSAFRDCTALADIILPASLTLIDSRAFNSCDSLTTINYKGSEEQWAKIKIESKNDALENATINYNFVCKHETTITIPGKAASCTETGLTDGEKCSVCGEVTTPQKNLDKIDHSYIVYVSITPSTCVTLGHKVMKCANCEATTNVALTEYANHTWNEGEITTNANCHAKGVKAFTCTICSKTRTEDVAINASNHDGKTEVRNAVNATCKAAGYTGDTYCKGCNAMLSTGTDIAPTAHTPAATYTHNSTHHWKICIVDGCGEEIAGSKVAHTTSDWIVEKAATVDTEGLEIKKCTVCEAKLEERVIPKLTPSYVLGDINGDGKVTATDARLILRIATKLEKLEEQKVTVFAAADVNGDGKITSVDARKVLRVATRLESF